MNVAFGINIYSEYRALLDSNILNSQFLISISEAIPSFIIFNF